MIPITPPVEVHIIKIEAIKDPQEYTDPKFFKTRTEALDFQKVHGGYLVNNYDGRVVVVFIPK